MKNVTRATASALASAALLAGAAAFTPSQAADSQTPAPSGANDWNCKPTAEHPNPVVLVHGTTENMQMNWWSLSPKIKDAGYCVFALNYGNNGTNRVAESAAELKTFIDKVKSSTGANKVDIVGHSQGGMMPRYYMRFLGGASSVGELVGLAPSNHGTTMASKDGSLCPACADQAADSDFMKKLNEGGDTEPGVDYTVISTKYDIIVTPYTSQALSGPADRVTNVVLQKQCPLNLAGHITMSYDNVAAQWVLNALDRRGPADPDFKPRCF